MKQSSLIKYLVAPVLFYQSACFAQEDAEINLVGQMSLGNKTMDLIISDRQFNPVFTTLNIGITALYQKFYLTLEHERSVQDAIQATGLGLLFFHREDTSLTFGYNVWEGLSAFVGYREGSTRNYYSASPDTSFGTESDGIYLGASYSYPVADHGTLGTSLAVAQLTGSVSLEEPFVDRNQFNPAFPPPNQVQGDAIGFSFGVSWTGEVSEATLYNVAFKIHRYEFEDDRIFGGIDLSFIEDFNTFSFGLTHFF